MDRTSFYICGKCSHKFNDTFTASGMHRCPECHTLTEAEPVETRRLVVVAVDDTSYWEIQEEDRPYVDKILTVYAYDAASVTYCCEITPSRWLEFLYFTVVTKPGSMPASDDEEYQTILERLNERYEVQPGPDDGGAYMWVSRVDRLEMSKNYGDVEAEDWDSTLENVRGNPPF